MIGSLLRVLGLLQAATATAPSSAGADRCVAEIRRQAVAAGVAEETVRNQLDGVTPDSTVLLAGARQPEFTIPIWDYLATLVDSERIAEGIRQLRTWDSVLGGVERRFGVDRHVVVAVWGIESDYGKILGNRSLVRSLLTGACAGRRQPFFRDQLIATLRIAQRGDFGSAPLLGSWAGAFGQTQFMPTTYLALAVDQDGDGRSDIVGSTPDALGSTANFLRKAGWVSDAGWGVEVRLPKKYRGPSGRLRRRTLAQWQAAGIRRIDGVRLGGADAAALLLPAGIKGPAFLIFRNYSAIRSYNAADAYALAIAHLADRLRGGVAFTTPWPTDDPGLSRAESREVQERLTARGHDIGAADGVFGAKTRAAVREFQLQAGLPVDGRAGLKLLDRLRAADPARPRADSTGANPKPA